MSNKNQRSKEVEKKRGRDTILFILLAGITIGCFIAGFILWGKV